MSRFRCYGCGKCCRIEKHSTVKEFEIAKEALAKLGISLRGFLLPDGFVLWPTPCPALSPDNKCLIYKKRPYPCRQFLCGKQSEDDARCWRSDGNFNMDYFNWLIKNNPEFAKIKRELEDKAVRWGRAHGWKLRRV
jgi:Fe-S-cluster containining protein